MFMDYEKAKQELLTSTNTGCQLFFKKHNCHLEMGYFQLFYGTLEEAKSEFREIYMFDRRAHWANFMVELLEGRVSYYPTYFELRNFFEIDLDLLVKHYKGDYVEKLINYSDFMSGINSEICKFIGRVFYNNNMKDYAEIFFKQAKEKFYNDPELHFLITQLHCDKKEFDLAIKSAKTCLEILPGYFPAENILRKLLQK